MTRKRGLQLEIKTWTMIITLQIKLSLYWAETAAEVIGDNVEGRASALFLTPHLGSTVWYLVDAYAPGLA